MKYTALSYFQKKMLHEDIRAGKNSQMIIEKYQISERTLRNEKKKLKDGTVDLPCASKSKYRKRNSNFPEIEEILIRELTSRRSFGFQLSKLVLMDLGRRAVNDLINDPSVPEDSKEKYRNFKLSEKWFTNFKKRHEMKFKKLNGEASSVPEDTEEKMNTIRSAILESGFPANRIYNFDETGLEYRSLGNYTYALKGDMCRGRKQDKTRVSILFGVNGDGSDFRTFVIGKSKSPRDVKKEDFDENSVEYYSSENAWMNSKIFESIMKKFDDSLEESSIVLIDNFRGHYINPPPVFKNIRIIFLPPNSTSVTQPLDHGIIALFKINFRSALLEKFYREMRDNSFKLNTITLKKILPIMKESVDSVKEGSIIKKCFHRTIKLSLFQEQVNDREDTIDEEILSSLERLQTNLQLISPSDVSLSEAYDFGVEIDFNENSIIREDDIDISSPSESEETKIEDPNRIFGCAERLVKYLKQTNGSPKSIKSVENIKKEIIGHLNFSEFNNKL